MKDMITNNQRKKRGEKQRGLVRNKSETTRERDTKTERLRREGKTEGSDH